MIHPIESGARLAVIFHHGENDHESSAVSIPGRRDRPTRAYFLEVTVYNFSIAPTSFGINLRINEKAAGRLMRTGVELREKSVGKMQEQANARMAEAQANGSGNGLRVDGSGNVQADSGTKIWGTDGLALGLLSEVPAELLAAGYVLERVYIEHKTGDKMCQLKLWYSKGEEAVPFSVSPAMQGEIDAVLASAYEHVHGFSNPNGSVTLNLSHRVDGLPPATVKKLSFSETGLSYERV